MTIQALAWAIDQQVPGEAKLVLIALANHADHTSGECRFDATIIAHEAAVTETSLPRYLGALRRNGFLARAETKGERHYWLQFDRETERAWAWGATEGDDATAEPERRTALVGGVAPSTFRAARQTEQRDEVVAAEATRAAQDVPVIDGSRAIIAWRGYLHRRGQVAPFIRTMIVNGKEVRGFPMPTLFPPAETAEADRAAE